MYSIPFHTCGTYLALNWICINVNFWRLMLPPKLFNTFPFKICWSRTCSRYFSVHMEKCPLARQPDLYVLGSHEDTRWYECMCRQKLLFSCRFLSHQPFFVLTRFNPYLHSSPLCCPLLLSRLITSAWQYHPLLSVHIHILLRILLSLQIVIKAP